MAITNATLTEVRAAGGIDAYGDVSSASEAAGALKWSGVKAAYLVRKRKSIMVGEVRKTVWMEILTIRGTLPIEVIGGEPASADTVLIVDARQPSQTKRFRVVSSDVRAVGGPVDSVRLEIEDARTP